MLTFVVGLSVIILIILFLYGFLNYNLKGMLEKFSKKEHFQNMNPSPVIPEKINVTYNEYGTGDDADSVRPIDDCRKYDMKGYDKLHTNVAVGLPDAPYKYNDYIGEIYIQKENQTLGRDNGKYCVKKPKLLFDGIWSPYLFEKEGWERVEWSLTDGGLFEGETCMKSLFNTLKPMPKWSPPDCPVKCLNDCKEDFYVYCNTEQLTESEKNKFKGGLDKAMNDPQDITDPNDANVICFPSMFSPDGNVNPTTKIGF